MFSNGVCVVAVNRVNRVVTIAIAIWLGAYALPTNAKADDQGDAGYFFNLTQENVTDVRINTVSLGITVPPLDYQSGWTIPPGTKIEPAILCNTTLNVTFESGKQWTNTLSICPQSGGGKVRNPAMSQSYFFQMATPCPMKQAKNWNLDFNKF